MGEDISRKTIVILTVLVMFLSILGTYTVIYELNKISEGPAPVVVKSSEAKGYVALNIMGGEAEDQPQALATGYVTLNIKSPDES